MRVFTGLGRRQCEDGWHGGYNLVVLIEPEGGPVYRRDVGLRVGEEEKVHVITQAMRRATSQIEHLVEEST